MVLFLLHLFLLLVLLYQSIVFLHPVLIVLIFLLLFLFLFLYFFLQINPSSFYFSFTVLLLFITLVRWNYLGIFPFVIAQIVTSLFQIYMFQTPVLETLASNLGSILFLFVIPLLLTKCSGNVKKSPSLTLAIRLDLYSYRHRRRGIPAMHRRS